MQSTTKAADHACHPVKSPPSKEIAVGLLTGCQDRPYAFGLAMALAAENVRVDIVGGNEIDSPEFHTRAGLSFRNLGGEHRSQASAAARVFRLFNYYRRLICYALFSQPRIYHILWNNRLEYVDRTILLLYYKVRRKKITLTAHNVNQARRDGTDSYLNRLTLRIQYRLADHIFVHTKKMKAELMEEFGVSGDVITVIRHPINDAFPDTQLTPTQAKKALGLKDTDRTILFFGRIRAYKGLDDLLTAFQLLLARDPRYRLIIAGEHKKGSEAYSRMINQMIAADCFADGQIISRMQFIPDHEAETYLKAADVMALPYKEIFQSGVLFLAYSYGLPVVASDVGSFREEIVEGETGFVSSPNDPTAFASTVERYFGSELYKNLDRRRCEIRDYAQAHHSWAAVAGLTREAYARLITR